MKKTTYIEEKIFQIIGQSADELGLDAYVVGGYVRDSLLGRAGKDIDIVCLGSGINLALQVAKNLAIPDYAVSVFKNFGTAMIRTEDGFELEFVGARKESYNHESRKPVVEEGTLQDDQNRRDFTINAMAISLNKSSWGDFLDPFDGQSDLQKQIIRTPLDPKITFSDDPLRMMRAVRFATQLGFDIEPDTFDSLITEKHRLAIISKERIADELNKIILAKKPSFGFLMLESCGILEIIFPEFVLLKGVEVEKGEDIKIISIIHSRF